MSKRVLRIFILLFCLILITSVSYIYGFRTAIKGVSVQKTDTKTEQLLGTLLDYYRINDQKSFVLLGNYESEAVQYETVYLVDRYPTPSFIQKVYEYELPAAAGILPPIFDVSLLSETVYLLSYGWGEYVIFDQNGNVLIDRLSGHNALPNRGHIFKYAEDKEISSKDEILFTMTDLNGNLLGQFYLNPFTKAGRVVSAK